MEFSKIRYHDGQVILVWTEKRKNDTIELRLVSTDEPEASFVEALSSIGPQICKLLGFAAEYVEELTVRSVSFKSEGCTIHATKKIEGSNSPFNIITPHMKRDSEGASTVPGDLAKAIDVLIAEAKRYHKGERVQIAMALAS